MSVARAQEEIDSAEFAEWLAYDRLDPFGRDRADLSRAMTAAAVVKAVRPDADLKIEMLMPDFESKQELPSSADARRARARMLSEKLMAWVNTHNATQQKV